jgi:hypothetical protein
MASTEGYGSGSSCAFGARSREFVFRKRLSIALYIYDNITFNRLHPGDVWPQKPESEALKKLLTRNLGRYTFRSAIH